MKKSVLICSLVIVLLVVSGCKGSTFGKFGKSPSSDSNAARTRVYTGTSGLEFAFLRNLPPNELFDKTNMKLVAEVRNLGSHSVTAADFYLSGYDPAIIAIRNGAEHKNVPEDGGQLEGKSEFLLEGGYETISFETSERMRLPVGTDEYKPRFILTACYEYRTLANPIVCIDPNKLNPAIDEKGACDEGASLAGGGQGAPVAVTNVDVDSNIDETFFRIEVQNVGMGQVVDRQISRSQGRCPFDLEYEHLDEVDFRVELTGASPIDSCKPRGNKVRLSDGRGVITCKFRIPPQNRFAYTTPLKVTLDYGYTESTSPRDVRIYRTGR